MELHELGIFFNLKELPRRGYATKAWEILMSHCDPGLLRSSHLFEGEIHGHLTGLEHMFCIAVRTPNLSALHYLRNTMGSSGDKGLAPPVDRFRESEIVTKHKLRRRGRIDSKGRLKTEEWSRADHDICKLTGWPYVPRQHPKHLRPELISELEEMSHPGLRQRGTSDKRRKAARNRNVKEVIRRFIAYGAVAGLIALFAIGWIAKDQLLRLVRNKREAVGARMSLGPDGYAHYEEGLSIVKLNRIPPDLKLDELNKKLLSKAYFIVEHPEDHLVDARMDCSVWGSMSEIPGAQVQTTSQYFIKLDMRSLNGTLIWTCVGKGVRNAPGRETENRHLREESLQAAIEDIDLSCLPDGRSVRNFQDNNDLAGLREYVASTSMQRKEELAQATPEDRDELRKELLAYLADQWIMTQRVHLASGRDLCALILREEENNYRLRVETGLVTIPKTQVRTIEPLKSTEITEYVASLIDSARKELTDEWKAQVRDACIEEFSEKCIQYGPPLPEVHLVRIEKNPRTGKQTAVVTTRKGNITARKGQLVTGFRVVGMDVESNSILVQKGEGGEILRVWP